jgi:mono/diheme cytochrome c family protein
VVSVRTDQLKERTRSVLPRWLASCLLVLPFAGLLYLGNASTVECGEGSALAVDRVSGLVENCDGTPFEGKGPGGGSTDYLALGESIFLGEAVTGVNCSGCHGAQGGGGVGPALNGVITTFGACADHEEWIAKGTLGFQAEGRDTYGSGKPVGGGGTMPGFAGSLSEEQIASVALFERVRFGGAAEEEALADCGLAPAGEEEGGATSTTAGEGGESPATTAPAP